MGDRFNAQSVNRAFELLCEEAQRNGIDVTGWTLERPDGRYWRLYRRVAQPYSVHYRAETLPFTNSFGTLPSNAREAHGVLTGWREGMAAIRLLRSQG